tara:strand:- start:888 stop:1121 length:234 start_codon:yes stop_codon:yes gene_type:complete
MSTDIWIAVGIVFVIVWIAIIWEAWNTPITPDNYNEDGINPDYERLKERINGSKNEEQYKKGLYNGEEDKWYPDNKI